MFGYIIVNGEEFNHFKRNVNVDLNRFDRELRNTADALREEIEQLNERLESLEQTFDLAEKKTGYDYNRLLEGHGFHSKYVREIWDRVDALAKYLKVEVEKVEAHFEAMPTDNE